MDEKIMRSLIDKELIDNYDVSVGFDIEHLDTFLPASLKLEKESLRDDPMVRVYERMIPSPEGASDIKLRIYEPVDRGEEAIPCTMFFHGGGFLFGSVLRQNDMCQRLVKNVGTAVVSVEYRLAPKYKAPAPIEDAYAALVWVDKNSALLGIDPARIAIAGLSAGGGVTAALALMTRDRKGPVPVLQIPLYAMLDYRADTYSQNAITSKKVWCYSYSKIAWDAYLDRSKEPDCYASPVLAEDLSGLPPVFSYVGALDPFLDENMGYWTRLIRAGVPVEYHVFPGCYHCFEVAVPESYYARMAYELMYSAMKRAFKV